MKRPAQLGLPAVEVFARVGVDGLVDPAVVLHVVHPIAEETDLTGALRSRRADGDWAVDGLLVDARRAQTVPRVGPGPADIDLFLPSRTAHRHAQSSGSQAWSRSSSPGSPSSCRESTEMRWYR